MCAIDTIDGNACSQQQPPDGADKQKQQRYNRHLRETLGSLALVVKKQHQTRFEQKLLAAKEQVGAAERRGWVCWGHGWWVRPAAVTAVEQHQAADRPGWGTEVHGHDAVVPPKCAA